MSDDSTASAATPTRANGLTRLTYTHDAMIDLIIQEPTVTRAELAELFGFSHGWVQRVLSSDAFQARLSDRKAVLVDPAIAGSVNERLRTVAMQALSIVSDKLGAEESASYAIDALGLSAKALGLQGTAKR
jgi:hypothetical protein